MVVEWKGLYVSDSKNAFSKAHSKAFFQSSTQKLCSDEVKEIKFIKFSSLTIHITDVQPPSNHSQP